MQDMNVLLFQNSQKVNVLLPKQNATEQTTPKPKRFQKFALLLIFKVLILYFAYNMLNGTFNTIKTQRFEQLKAHIQSGKTLTESEKDEFCQLLQEVKGIYLNNCIENIYTPYLFAILDIRHGGFYDTYKNKPDKELSKAIKSYEKQILIHKEKIANPVKYYPDWESLYPKRKTALLEKLWPDEILNLTEEKQILEEILKQRPYGK